jgi:hypothetical protein
MEVSWQDPLGHTTRPELGTAAAPKGEGVECIDEAAWLLI